MFLTVGSGPWRFHGWLEKPEPNGRNYQTRCESTVQAVQGFALTARDSLGVGSCFTHVVVELCFAETSESELTVLNHTAVCPKLEDL